MTSDRWPQIDRLYHEALERRPEERPAFLDAACAGDETLRRELDSLLGYQTAAEGFLEQSALQHAAQQLSGDTAAPLPDPRVPGYTILKVLGEGGMGVVYLADQLVPIRRQVALKLIKHGMDTRQVVARFDVERQALALMNHPNIAAVYDAGTTGDGRPYFVMEYVDGEQITDYCDRQRLSTRARLELFTDVCAAVQHAHQKGVIHRDLKPSNVLVSDQDGRALPKIIDFGVAKAIATTLTARAAFTEQGTMVGTPEYMSPEQAALSDDIDTTTDVYSLGVLLYELLVGALPFDPKMLRAVGYDEMRRVIRESDPPKPSSRLTSPDAAAGAAAIARQTDAGRLTRELKGDLDWITLKALEKDRRQRYPTVAAFAADIGHYLANEPILARPPSAVYRMRTFTRRYRGAVLAVAAVFLALVTGLGASITQYVRAERQRAEAERQRSQAELQRTTAESAAREAAAQRNVAVLATDDANRQRIVATNEAAAATDARREAEYRVYVSTIVAADAELRQYLASAARNRLLAVPQDLRGWEWQHLFLKTDTSLVTLTSTTPCARPGEQNANPITLSDQVLATGNGGARLYLRRCATLEVWDGAAFAHATYVAPAKILSIGPAGEALVVGRTGPERDAPWSLRLIDPRTGRALHQVGPFEAEPICADISRDGLRLAVGFTPKFSVIGEPLEDFFDVWDLRAERRLVTLAPRKPPLFDTRNRFPTSCRVAFSPNAARLATSGATVNVWLPDSGLPVAADDTQAGLVGQPIAWSGDGSRLAIGRLTGLVDILDLTAAPRVNHLDGSGFIRVLPLPDGDRRILVPNRRAGEVLSVAFSTDGTRVVTGTDTRVGVWDVTQKRLTQVLAGHDAQVIGVVADVAGRIVSADANGQVKVWRSSDVAAMTVLPGSISPRKEFALSDNGAVVAAAQSDGALYAWRLSDLHQTVLRAGAGELDNRNSATSLAMSPNGRRLFAGEYDDAGTVRAWNVEAGDSTAMPLNAEPVPGCERVNLGTNGNLVEHMAVSPDGRTLVFRQSHCTVALDLATTDVVATLHENPASIVFRPDGSVVLLVRATLQDAQPPWPAKMIIWDWRANRVRAEVPTPLNHSYAESGSWHVAMSANGGRIALVGGRPATVSIWDGDLHHELGRLPVPPDTQAVALSPDGHRLASTGGDTTVRIWDVDRRQVLLILTDDDQHAAGGLAFTPDGRLIAGRSSGGLTIWESLKTPLSPSVR